MLSGMAKCAERGRKVTNIRLLRIETALPGCPVSWRVSGFAVPKETLIPANVIRAWNSGNAIPDRITAGLEGWNMEPVFRPFWTGGQKSTGPFLMPFSLAEWGINGRLRAPPRAAASKQASGEPQGSLRVASGCLPVSHQIARGWLQGGLGVAATRLGPSSLCVDTCPDRLCWALAQKKSAGQGEPGRRREEIAA